MTILYMEERNIYSKLIQVEKISDICKARHKKWISLVNITENSLANEFVSSNNGRATFSKRESISLTLGIIAKIERDFTEIISKLEFKEKVDDKLLFKSLQKLNISFPGVDIDIPKKALFIVIAKQFEDEIISKKA